MFRRLKQKLHPRRPQQSPTIKSKGPPMMDQKYNEGTLRYVIAPISEILSSIEDRKTDIGLTPVRRELFELETLLSSIIDSHHHSNNNNGDRDAKGGEKGDLPSYEDIYKEVITTTLVSLPIPPVQALSPEAPTLKRKPHGLLQRLTATEEKSSREKALESLMRLVSATAGEKTRSRPIFPEETRLGAARRRAIENLAKRGWDMREVIPRECVKKTGDLVNEMG